MRLKGINPIEQHVEKGVAGLFGLALLGVLAWQFLGGQSTVTVDKSEVPIANGYNQIAQNARRLDSSLQATPDTKHLVDVSKITKSFENFEEAIKAPVAPNPQLAHALDKPAMLLKDGKSIGASADAPIAEVVVPAPERATAATYLGTVGTAEAQNPEVAKILPATAPFDKAAVTVEAMFDGTALRKAFEADPDGDTGPIRVVPKNWWENGVQILVVNLTRQTLKPDGTWSASEKVKGMPGRLLLVEQADTLNDADSLRNAMKIASDTEMVRRTPYYSVSMGEAWAAPTERDAIVEAGQNKAAEIKTLRQQLANDDREIKRIDEQMQKIGQPIAPAPGGGGGGGGGGRGGSPGGGGAAPSPQQSGQNSADEARKRALTAARTKAVDRRTKAIARLRELGEIVEGADNAPVQMQDPKQAAKAETPVLDNSAIRIWAHDVFVERGKTYRYQIGLVVTNPYFGHSAAMVPAQAEKLAKSGVMHSAPSEWTEPVTVDRETYTFFTSAVEDDPASGANASARAEVFQFKWGFWRRGGNSYEPGDRVVANINVPDYAKFLTEAPAPGQGNPGQPPAPAPGRPGGGRGGGANAPAGPAPTAPNPGDATPIPVGTQIPMMTVAVPSTDLILSVGHGPGRGSGARSPEVFVRDGEGAVRVVQPDLEKLDPVFVRISKSAERGEKERSTPSEKPRPAQQPGMPDPRDGRPGGAPAGG